MKPLAPDLARLAALVRAGRVEVHCSLCSAPTVLVLSVDHASDAVALAPHRYPVPIVAAGALPFVWHARCPMSWAPLSAVCDGEHAAPACSDPECYHATPSFAEAGERTGLDARGACVKCGAGSGDGWTQCKGSCPVPMSPHYDRSWRP